MLRNRHMIMAPEGETSSGGAAVNAQILESADPNETFDNMEYESESSKKAGEAFNDKFKERIEKAKKAKEALDEDGEKEKPKAKESKKGSDLDLVKSEDEEMDLDDKEAKPKEKKAEKEKEDEEEVTEEKPEAKKDEEKKVGDKLKIRMADGLYAIEKDAKVRVKIDGEFQEVPVQELINQYSGKVAYDKKFTEIGQKNKELEMKSQHVEKTQKYLNDTVGEILKVLDDPNANPYDAMSILVEKSGRDHFTLWKRSLENNLDEVEKLMAMSETERKLYFAEKKDEFRTKSEEARKAAVQKEEAFNQALSKMDSLRQAHGISEEQFLKALDELEADGVDTLKMSDEQLVDYASLKPHITTVQDVLEPYEAQLNDSKYSEVVSKLARELRSGEFTKEQLTEWAKKEFRDEDLKDLQQRTKEVTRKTSKEAPKTPEKIETLDSWDD